MQPTPNASSPQPASAVRIIALRLEQLNVFAPAIDESESALWALAGSIFAETAANVVGSLSTDRRLTYRARRRAGSEALMHARIADMCMERAAALAGAAGDKGGA